VFEGINTYASDLGWNCSGRFRNIGISKLVHDALNMKFNYCLSTEIALIANQLLQGKEYDRLL
jgi:hypothetical protein